MLSNNRPWSRIFFFNTRRCAHDDAFMNNTPVEFDDDTRPPRLSPRNERTRSRGTCVHGTFGNSSCVVCCSHFLRRRRKLGGAYAISVVLKHGVPPLSSTADVTRSFFPSRIASRFSERSAWVVVVESSRTKSIESFHYDSRAVVGKFNYGH